MKISDLDLGFDARPVFRPYKYNKEYMATLFQDVPESVKVYARQILSEGWKIYTVDQSRGRCYGGDKVITIPVWAIRKSLDYRTWYIAHELAHAYDKCIHGHGPEFMEWLKKICPANSIHRELGYKPRNARAAGIKKPGEIDPFDLF